MELYERVRSAAYAALPAELQRAYLAPPTLSLRVEPAGAGFRLADSHELTERAPEALVPKLGIKSWRASGTLATIYAGVQLGPFLERLLRHPTDAQRICARAWTRADRPLALHLSPYVDLSTSSEVRFLASARGAQRVSACVRGPVDLPAVLATATRFVEGLRPHLPDRSQILDVVVLPDASARLVEVNPALSRGELQWLRAA